MNKKEKEYIENDVTQTISMKKHVDKVYINKKVVPGKDGDLESQNLFGRYVMVFFNDANTVFCRVHKTMPDSLYVHFGSRHWATLKKEDIVMIKVLS